MDQRSALASSWEKNAGNWTKAVREGLIPSRGAGTDAAILEAVCSQKPQHFLDVGCGEGWLVRAVAQSTGCKAIGIDGSARLIDDARQADPDGRYQVVSYGELMEGSDHFDGVFDVIAFNYALFDEDAPKLLASVRPYLSTKGVIIIQTLHPWTVAQDGNYHDAWRKEDFSAFQNQDWTAMPWFFRTLSSWYNVVRNAGLTLDQLTEPTAESGGLPLSLLLACVVLNNNTRK